MKDKGYQIGARALSVVFMSMLATNLAYSQIRVVNITPETRSRETNTDNEPNIAVNPMNPNVIVISAFTPSRAVQSDSSTAFCGAPNTAPVFVSIDGGVTWDLSCIVPSDTAGSGTGDITIKFAGVGNTLYGGILRRPSPGLRMNILRTNDLTTLMTVLVVRDGVDQPYIQAATEAFGNVDRVYIGNNNNLFVGPRTATVDLSLDAATAPPAGFNPFLIETRTAATTPFGAQDGPSIRPAIHADGTVYAAFFGWRTFSSPTNTSDIVVVRDDDWGMGATPFNDLIDTDTMAGVRVATAVAIPSLGTLLGNQRIGSQLSIAVDPRDSRTVYLAWADGTTANGYTIHVRRSTMGGAAGSWSGDLRAITSATNPALAINSQGVVGLLYQRLVNTMSGNRWETHFERTSDGFATPPTDVVLANVPDDLFGNGAGPLGDYIDLMAVGRDFYGTFSAKNSPNMANFPSGVTYLRQANFTTGLLYTDATQTTTVPASIDTFFFSAVEPAADLAITKTASPGTVVTGSTVTYTLTVRNNGPADASSVMVTDNLPGSTFFTGCSVSGGIGGACGGAGNNQTINFTSIPANMTATIILTARVECSVADGAIISNAATVSSSTPDPDTANNTALPATITASNPAPVLSCPANRTVFNDPGQCFATLNPGMATAADNCPGVTVAGVRSDGLPLTSPYPVGGTTITWTATDSGGRSSSCAQTVTVVDNEKPRIDCPDDIFAVTAAPGDVSVVVNYAPPTVMDNCPTVTVICSIPSGASFPLGSTTVTCTATDASGNTESCSFVVTVFDVCIQDDVTGDHLYFNTLTGDYLFEHCGPDRFTMKGKGSITRSGSSTLLRDDTRVVSAEIIRSTLGIGNRGSASIRNGPFGTTYVLNDTYILNNNCACP